MTRAAGDAPLLSAALIVKDEERHLPACLESLSRLGDLISEVCIYDTGSSDSTLAIAERAGCRIERGYWDDDFARARNSALAMVQSVWALSIDADERIEGDAVLLEDTLRSVTASDQDLHALAATISSWDRGVALPSAVIPRIVRVSSAHWQGRIHEQIRPREGGTPFRVSPLPPRTLVLWHEGYGGEGVLRGKAQRNLAVSELEVAECRARAGEPVELAGALIHRARSRRVLGDNAGVIADCREARGLTDGAASRYAGELMLEALGATGALDEAAALLPHLADEGTDPQWLTWTAARLIAAQGDPTSALSLLRSVDSAYTSLKESVPPALLLRDRMVLASEAGEVDEAISTALVLVVHHQLPGVGVPTLLHWWAGSSESLAQLLTQNGEAPPPALLAALTAQGEAGRQVVQHLDAPKSTAAQGLPNAAK